MSLKLIALLSMTIDHYGIFFGNDYYLYRLIGRLAFPLFVYVLVKNYIYYVKSYKKYFLNLLIFSLVSQPIFYFSGVGQFEYELNIIFTLMNGIAAVYVYENRVFIKNKFNCSAIYIFILLAELSIFTGYGLAGFSLIISFYMYLKDRNKVNYFLVIVSMMSSMGVFVFWFAIPIIMILIGEEKNINFVKYNKKYKYIFYFFYPLHLLVFSNLQ